MAKKSEAQAVLDEFFSDERSGVQLLINPLRKRSAGLS